MKCAFLTNMPSHHQFPCGLALQRILGAGFHLGFLESLPEGRVGIGWEDVGSGLPWIIRAWESEQEQERLRACIEDSDVVIYGAVPTDLVRSRILQGKLTLKYSERMFKRGIFLGFPWWFRRLARDYWPLNLPNHHFLAAGAYCAEDMRHVGLYKGRMWKWGYFTSVPSSPPVSRSSDCVRMLWAGRMLNWKRVDLLLRAAHDLKMKGHQFSLDLIGLGPEKERLICLSRRLGLEDLVQFLPPTSPERVREAMQRAHIYLLPSDYGEGWGAVINEAMSEGCCVVTSLGPGAAPWLIEHGITGFHFPSGDVNALCAILEFLLHKPEQCHQIGLNAWESMKSLWSPEVAADHLVALVSGLLGMRRMPDFREGPGSPTG